ncbi:hypothetical protein Spla01_06571 [Streptomyces platensis]|uniref:Uncharacterized protein n=1 Tax=Streptomyces platensis TaxID=58346 RepID=A0ABX3Y071_STRPT|nr:hypothetical protein BG653_02152 [Streptomyces platensis]
MQDLPGRRRAQGQSVQALPNEAAAATAEWPALGEATGAATCTGCRPGSTDRRRRPGHRDAPMQYDHDAASARRSEPRVCGPRKDAHQPVGDAGARPAGRSIQGALPRTRKGPFALNAWPLEPAQQKVPRRSSRTGDSGGAGDDSPRVRDREVGSHRGADSGRRPSGGRRASALSRPTSCPGRPRCTRRRPACLRLMPSGIWESDDLPEEHDCQVPRRRHGFRLLRHMSADRRPDPSWRSGPGRTRWAWCRSDWSSRRNRTCGLAGSASGC